MAFTQLGKRYSKTAEKQETENKMAKNFFYKNLTEFYQKWLLKFVLFSVIFNSSHKLFIFSEVSHEYRQREIP